MKVRKVKTFQTYFVFSKGQILLFIYLLIMICGSFTLGRLFDFIFAHSRLNGSSLLFFEKLFLRKKLFKLFFVLFYSHSLFHGEKSISFQFSSIRNHNMGCYLYVGQTFQQLLILTQTVFFHLIL